MRDSRDFLNILVIIGFHVIYEWIYSEYYIFTLKISLRYEFVHLTQISKYNDGSISRRSYFLSIEKCEKLYEKLIEKESLLQSL